jgi:hypothetical protein
LIVILAERQPPRVVKKLVIEAGVVTSRKMPQRMYLSRDPTVTDAVLATATFIHSRPSSSRVEKCLRTCP